MYYQYFCTFYYKFATMEFYLGFTFRDNLTNWNDFEHALFYNFNLFKQTWMF